eukprot:167997-Chlamydomonas_euryale.AAC.3
MYPDCSRFYQHAMVCMPFAILPSPLPRRCVREGRYLSVRLAWPSVPPISRCCPEPWRPKEMCFLCRQAPLPSACTYPVHVVVARAALVAHPYAKVLDGGGTLLEDLWAGRQQRSQEIIQTRRPPGKRSFLRVDAARLEHVDIRTRKQTACRSFCVKLFSRWTACTWLDGCPTGGLELHGTAMLEGTHAHGQPRQHGHDAMQKANVRHLPTMHACKF